MSEDKKKQLEQQLWNIANTLRGKMNADEFRDYTLGFILPVKFCNTRCLPGQLVIGDQERGLTSCSDCGSSLR
jgi:hypothetical protein